MTLFLGQMWSFLTIGFKIMYFLKLRMPVVGETPMYPNDKL